jgi:hypothetical protein
MKLGMMFEDQAMTEAIPEIIDRAMSTCPDFLDFPTAWAIQKDRGETLTHHPRCSSVHGWDPISGPAFLCDCGAVTAEYDRLRAIKQGDQP